MFISVDLSTVSGNRCTNASPIKAPAANPTRYSKSLSSISSFKAILIIPTKEIKLMKSELRSINGNICTL